MGVCEAKRDTYKGYFLVYSTQRMRLYGHGDGGRRIESSSAEQKDSRLDGGFLSMSLSLKEVAAVSV